MRVDFNVSKDNWVHLALTAETPKEVSDLVRHGLNANATSRKVFDVCAGAESVVGYVCLRTRKTGQINTVG